VIYLNYMKNILILIGVIIVAAAAYFLFIAKEDPMVTQAKEEVRQAEAALERYQNTVNAIPALELSQDINNDFKIESNYLGAIGSVVSGENQPAKVMLYMEKIMAAAESRGSARFQFDFDRGLEDASGNAAKVSEVASEDLGVLDKLANTFDTQVEQAKANAPQLTPLIVERNKKTEKYFLEFERIEQKLKALIASLDNYSSADFRKKIKKLKPANELFGKIANYTKALIQGKARGYALGVSEVFPALKDEEAKAKNCFWARSSGCEQVGPFTAEYQQMLIKLEGIYVQLIEN